MIVMFDEVPYSVQLDEAAFRRWWSALRPERAEVLAAHVGRLRRETAGGDLAEQVQSLVLAVFGQDDVLDGDESAADARVLMVQVEELALREVRVQLDLDPAFDTGGMPDGLDVVVSLAIGADVFGRPDGAFVQVRAWERDARTFVAEDGAAPADAILDILRIAVEVIAHELDRRRQFARRLGDLIADGAPSAWERAQVYFAPPMTARSVQELATRLAGMPRESLACGEYDPRRDNGVRARWAARGLVAFAEHLGDATLTSEDTATALVDFIADLLHLADALGEDTATLLTRTIMHYDAELVGA